MRPAGAHEERDLGPVDHRIEARRGLELGGHGIGSGVRLATVIQLLDAVETSS